MLDTVWATKIDVVSGGNKKEMTPEKQAGESD